MAREKFILSGFTSGWIFAVCVCTSLPVYIGAISRRRDWPTESGEAFFSVTWLERESPSYGIGCYKQRFGGVVNLSAPPQLHQGDPFARHGSYNSLMLSNEPCPSP